MNTQPLPRVTAPRNALILEHVAVAHRIATRISRRCPAWVPREDLVSAGMLGLAEAAARYDMTRKEPFIPFAEKRIRGAILDELRRGDIMPRRVRQKARKVIAAIADLEKQTGSAPRDEAVAAALGVTVTDYRTNLEHLAHVTVAALEDADALPGDHAGSPETEAARAQSIARVRAALPALEQRDVSLLSLYYVDELTFAEIAHVMAITSARVSQLHTRAIVRLRAAIDAVSAS